MKRALIVSAFGLLMAFPAFAQDKPTYRVIGEKELPALIASRPNLVLLDARMPEERGQWGLKCERCSTVQVPFDFGADDKSAASALAKFKSAVAADKTLQAARQAKQEVLVVCLAGGRSGAAAGEMQKLGFQPVLLDGGLNGLTDARNISGTKPPG